MTVCWKMQNKEKAEITNRGVASEKQPMDAASWEELKEAAKTKLWQYSKETSTAAKQEKKKLILTLKTLIRAENDMPEVFTQDMKDCKEQLFYIMEKKCREAVVRSMVQDPGKKEQRSKLFKTKKKTVVDGMTPEPFKQVTRLYWSRLPSRNNLLKRTKNLMIVSASHQCVSSTRFFKLCRLFQRE